MQPHLHLHMEVHDDAPQLRGHILQEDPVGAPVCQNQRLRQTGEGVDQVATVTHLYILRFVARDAVLAQPETS